MKYTRPKLSTPVGQTINGWLVLGNAPSVGTRSMWRVQCAAGHETARPGTRVKSGRAAGCQQCRYAAQEARMRETRKLPRPKTGTLEACWPMPNQEHRLCH